MQGIASANTCVREQAQVEGAPERIWEPCREAGGVSNGRGCEEETEVDRSLDGLVCCGREPGQCR